MNSHKFQKEYGAPGQLSYLSVPGELPLLDLTMGKLIDEAAQKFGNREAVVVSTPIEVRKTFIQIKEEADELAAGLLSLGLRQGDRVGIWGPNSYEWYLTNAAGMKAGLIMVYINPAYKEREIEYCLNAVGIKCMVIAEQHFSSNYYNLIVATVPEITVSEPGSINSRVAPNLKILISFASEHFKGAFSLEEVLERGQKVSNKILLQDIERVVQFDDICNIQFTSGTTGNPKGVMLTHHNIVNNGLLIGRRFSYSENDKICIPVPLFHSYGSVLGIICGLHTGATCVLPSPGFLPKEVLKSVSTERCTVVYGTPTMHIDVLHVPGFEKYEVSSLRLAVTGAAICPEELIRQMKTKYTVENVGSCYGMTETSPISFQSLPADSDKLRAETVGYPLEHTEVKVIDTEGRTVKIGKEGELCIRGYLNMLGYWDDVDKAAETIDAARWLHTGDLVIMSQSGHTRIVGRLKDMIIRGGENVYPKEVENFLHTHPAVQEAQVFGVPDSRMGEEVAAWIYLKDGELLTHVELNNFCKGKIAHFKIPRYVKFTKTFPKTTSGKIQKYKMREKTIKELQIEE